MDGMRFVKSNIAIVDGTAPHCFDPLFPAIDGEIVNLSDCIDGGVRKHERGIREFNGEKKQHYSLAFAYLKAAVEIERANDLTLSSLTDDSLGLFFAEEVLKTLSEQKENSAALYSIMKKAHKSRTCAACSLQQ